MSREIRLSSLRVLYSHVFSEYDGYKVDLSLCGIPPMHYDGRMSRDKYGAYINGATFSYLSGKGLRDRLAAVKRHYGLRWCPRCLEKLD